ncbi:hypothetical protein [uncultured Kordia sp.]|uniref:hypothetical protein n=1 Tax=uncultured Kordia sp. TaxID=507699 RepID=UPI0026295D7B|nr:hypothetical protein [uncultured Kordia sp.]
MLKKILNLAGVDALSKIEQIETQGGKIVPTLATSFMCYCNNIYIGEKKSVQDCWKTC